MTDSVFVILSEAKNLIVPLRVNSAKNLAVSLRIHGSTSSPYILSLSKDSFVDPKRRPGGVCVHLLA